MKKPTEKQLKYWESMRGKRNDEARNWKEKIKKSAVHRWLVVNFGKPRKCEKCGRTNKKSYDWACKDHKYQRKREDFMRLCTSCHRLHDLENGLIEIGDRDISGKFITIKD
jgi:hypothetical protein